MGTLSGLGAAISAVALVHAQARRQQRERCLVQQDAPAEKPLEVR
jgi:hypothetical protein